MTYLGRRGWNPYTSRDEPSATVEVMARSERSLALTISLVYLVVGAGAWWTSSYLDPTSGAARQAGPTMLGLWVTVIVLAGFALLPWRDSIVTWMAPAVVGPLALAPLMLHPGQPAAIAIAILWPAATIPLGQALASDAPGRVASLVAAATAMALGLAIAILPGSPVNEFAILRYAAVIAIVAVPGIERLAQASRATEISPASVTTRAEVAAAVVAASLAGLVLVTAWEVGAAVLITMLAGALVASWIAVRPLTWIVSRDVARRSAIVAANEAERIRLAADIHDGPLQDALLLARRLDDAGDHDGATLARSIAADLRDLSGDLRLPLLDDLGVGPSLEWLAGRVRRTTALEVRTDVEAGARLPRPVEVAAYRIAQEALANAVRHGEPPILVRCRTSPESLSMSVVDAGPGLASEADGPNTTALRLGLASMRQRAEQIDAELGWSSAAGVGTTVTLEWRGRGA